MRVPAVAPLIALLACCARTPAPAAHLADSTPPAKAISALAYLRGYVGRYPSDTVFWDSEPLRSRMTKLLGGDYQLFRDNIVTSGPVGEASGLLYLTGNCASSAKAWGGAVLVADPVGDKLLLMLFTDAGGMKVYKEGEVGTLPPEVSTTLRGWDERLSAGKKPAAKKKPAETKG